MESGINASFKDFSTSGVFYRPRNRPRFHRIAISKPNGRSWCLQFLLKSYSLRPLLGKKKFDFHRQVGKLAFPFELGSEIQRGFPPIMNWRVEVSTRQDFPDTHGQVLLAQIRDLGINSVQVLRFIRVFLIQAEADREAVTKAAAELLADPITEQFYLGQSKSPPGMVKAS